jgi:hypothetical protein
VRVWLKREDLAHTGAHKINNAIGQALIARRMGKRRVIAETGAGQHGVATATACARFGLDCEVYMGEEDTRRQALNVFRMELLGAKVIPVRSGSRTLKDAMSEALRDWATNVRATYYLIGSTAGPHPYPMLVRDLQAVIGEEARAQITAAEGRLPGFDELAKRAETMTLARVGWPAPREPEDAIDAAEHDLAVLDALLRAPEPRPGTARYLLEANPHLGRALRFRGRRWWKRWTWADGLVAAPEPGREAAAARGLEAIRDHALTERSFSPTALQHFAACPYRFFLQAVHRLAPRDVPEAIE